MASVFWNVLAVSIELNTQMKVKSVIGTILCAKLATLINQKSVRNASICPTLLQGHSQENAQLNALQVKHLSFKLNSHLLLVIDIASRLALSITAMFVSIALIASNAKPGISIQKLLIFVWINVLMALFLILYNVSHALTNARSAILVAIA